MCPAVCQFQHGFFGEGGGVRLEAFSATELNEMSSGSQPCQDVKFFFSDVWELTLFPSSGCAGGLIEPKLKTRCHTLCSVYLCLARARDGMRTLWLVAGVERSFCLSSRYPVCGKEGNPMSPK
jgi:hypothetical protein